LSAPDRKGQTDEVAKVVLIVTALLMPTLVGALGVVIARLARLWRRRQARSARGLAVPPVPLERAAADVRRLRAQLERLEEQPPGPGRAMRTRALREAYGDALATACRVLEVPPPADPHRLPRSEQYRVESALRDKGLDVVRTALR
jgi:hypothetical protein